MKSKVADSNSDFNVNELYNSELYIAINKKIEELSQGGFSQTKLKKRCYSIATKLYELSGKDLNLSIAGLLYHLTFNCEEWEQKFDILTQYLNSDILKLINSLEMLNRQILKGFKNKIDDDFEINKVITMIFAALGQDKNVRALVIEIIHRLESLKNINDLSLDNNIRNRFVLESFRIFSPIANRLGLWNIKWQIEDMCFKEIETHIYYRITESVEETRSQRDKYMSLCIEKVKETIALNILDSDNDNDENIKEDNKKFEVIGRSKSIYSIYLKMKQLYCYSINTSVSKISSEKFNSILKSNFDELFEAVHDLFGIRIICDSKLLCYEILDIIQKEYPRISTFRRKSGELVDYIVAPKSNGYQSLHLVVLGPQEKRLEIQIRTYNMDAEAEYGIAAHWKYKELGQSKSTLEKDYAFTEIKRFIDNNGISATQEILSNLNSEFFNSKIYVFTPDGNIITLPKESTPVDFAYSIHSEIGDKCIGARVNDEGMVTLNSYLHNGDIVEIITQKNAHPNISWLEFVKTSKAKAKIKHWIKNSYKDDFVTRGKENLEKALIKNKIKVSLRSKQMEKVAKEFNYQSIDDLFAGIAYGRNNAVSINQVINFLKEEETTKKVYENNKEIDLIIQKQTSSNGFSSCYKNSSSIIGIEGLLHHIAGCCNPIPPEPIVGVVTRSRGISIHSQNCMHLSQISDERHIAISWNTQNNSDTYLLNLQIQAIDRVGLMRDICSCLADHEINISSLTVSPPGSKNKNALINLCIEVHNKKHFQDSVSLIKKVPGILTLKRIVS